MGVVLDFDPRKPWKESLNIVGVAGGGIEALLVRPSIGCTPSPHPWADIDNPLGSGGIT